MNEKVKALHSIRKYSKQEALEAFIPGQYIEGRIDGKNFVDYRSEPSVAPDSNTETFVAGKFLIDNDRWAGVPFYVRSGKRLTEKEHELTLFSNKTLIIFLIQILGKTSLPFISSLLKASPLQLMGKKLAKDSISRLSNWATVMMQQF